MWSTTSTSATAAASTVVSETGLSLSPKYAPPTMAPAVAAAGMPSPPAMAMKAMPKVPAVPQDVPVSRDAREQITKTEGRKIAGARRRRPDQTR